MQVSIFADAVPVDRFVLRWVVLRAAGGGRRGRVDDSYELTWTSQSLPAHDVVRGVELPLVAEHDRVADAVPVDRVVLRRVVLRGAGGGRRVRVVGRAGRRYGVTRHLQGETL